MSELVNRKMSRRSLFKFFASVASVADPGAAALIAGVAYATGNATDAKTYLGLGLSGLGARLLTACGAAQDGVPAVVRNNENLQLFDPELSRFAYSPPVRVINGVPLGNVDLSAINLQEDGVSLAIIRLDPTAARALDLRGDGEFATPVIMTPRDGIFPGSAISINAFSPAGQEKILRGPISEITLTIDNILPALFSDPNAGASISTADITQSFNLMRGTHNQMLITPGDPRIAGLRILEEFPGGQKMISVQINFVNGEVKYTRLPKGNFNKQTLMKVHVAARHSNHHPWGGDLDVPTASQALGRWEEVRAGNATLQEIAQINAGNRTHHVVQITGENGLNHGAGIIFHSIPDGTDTWPEMKTAFAINNTRGLGGITNPKSSWESSILLIDNAIDSGKHQKGGVHLIIGGTEITPAEWLALSREQKFARLLDAGALAPELPSAQSSLLSIVRARGMNVLSVVPSVLSLRWGEVVRQVHDEGRPLPDVLAQRYVLDSFPLPQTAGSAYPVAVAEINPTQLRDPGSDEKPILINPTMVDPELGIIGSQTADDIALPLYIRKEMTSEGPSIAFLSPNTTTIDGDIIENEYSSNAGNMCNVPEPVVVPLQRVDVIPSRDQFNYAVSTCTGFPFMDGGKFPSDWNVTTLSREADWINEQNQPESMTTTMYAAAFVDPSGNSVVYLGKRRSMDVIV